MLPYTEKEKKSPTRQANSVRCWRQLGTLSNAELTSDVKQLVLLRSLRQPLFSDSTKAQTDRLIRVLMCTIVVLPSRTHCHLFDITKPQRSAQTGYLCFVWIWEQTAIISLYSNNWLVFITETVCLLRGTDWIFNHLKPSGYYMYHQFNTQQFYALPTLYLCVLCESQNKQRLFPYTALTDSFL